MSAILTGAPDRYRIGIPITKIDDEKRIIRGNATVEAVDADEEVVDYDTAKTVIAGTWPGNVREMHGLVAVGTGVIARCDDTTKSIEIEAHISEGAESTWKKIKDGTLKAFSIGGKAAKRVVEKVGEKTIKRLFLQNCSEISVVDAGACPGTGFAIVKVLETGELQAQPDDTAVIPGNAEAFAKAVAAELDKVAKASKADTDKDKNKTASGKIASHYAGVDGKSYPIEDPIDVHNAAQAIGRVKDPGDRAKTKANIIRIAYQLGDSYVKQLPEPWKKKEDQKVVRALRADLVKRGFAPDDIDAILRKYAPEPWDVDRACDLISDLNALMASEMFQAAMGEDDDAAQVQMLREALQLTVQFLAHEIAEQYADSPEVDLEDKGVPPVEAAEATMTRIASLVKAAIDVLNAPVEKVGAEFSAKNKQKIQAIHDHAASMGAECGPAGDEDDEEAKALKARLETAGLDAVAIAKVLKAGKKPPTPPACKNCDGTGDCPECDGTGKVPMKADDDEDDEAKAQKAGKKMDCPECEGSGNCSACNGTGAKGMKKSRIVKTLEATTTAQAATIADLTKRLDHLERSPSDGGPQRTTGAPGAKALPGGTPSASELSDAAMDEALKALAAEATTEQERITIATLAVAHQHKRPVAR